MKYNFGPLMHILNGSSPFWQEICLSRLINYLSRLINIHLFVSVLYE